MVFRNPRHVFPNGGGLDNAGAQTTSATTTLVENAPPAISIASPITKTTFELGQPVSISVAASDSDGVVSKVEFFAGGNKIGESTVIPFDFTWSDAAIGNYALTAAVTDNTGAQTISATVNIMVKELPPTPTPGTTPTPTPSPTPPLNFGDRLASGIYSATLALQSDGSLWSWGSDFTTPFGNPDYRGRTYPTALTGLSGIISVSAGPYHAAILKSDGTVLTAGQNDSGQLGDGSTTRRTIFSTVANLTNVISIKSGQYHTLALRADGTIAAWGDNGPAMRSLVPIPISSLSDVKVIAAGSDRSVAIKSDGTVWSWGTRRPLFPFSYNPIPVQIAGLINATAISAGGGFAVAAQSDGSVWAWGANLNGELGNGLTVAYFDSPVRVSNISSAVAVASGQNHTLALLADGSVWAWGGNVYGQLGNGTTNSAQRIPVQVSGLNNVIAVAAAQGYSMALKSDGTIWAWGQVGPHLGVVAQDSVLTPRQIVLGLSDANANGMDDRWETDFFGNLNQPAAGDFDGDGFTNLREFQDQTSPIDYFNGARPIISVVGGDNQIGEPGTFLFDPLVVEVRNSTGQLLINAPVVFSVNGLGDFGATPDDTALQRSLTARTGADGRAAGYWYTPYHSNYTSVIDAHAGIGASSASVQFTENTTTATPPIPPSEVTAVRNPDGTTTITWTDNSENEDDFVLQRQNPDGTWEDVEYLDPNTTSITLPNR